MKNTESKSGGILVMVMVVFLAISSLTLGFFKLQESTSIEAVHVEQSNQAFWIAETGLQQALNKLRSDKTYRNNIGSIGSPSNESDIVGSGAYSVDLWLAASGGFVLESLGTVQNVQRKLRLEAGLSNFGDYGLVTLDGDSRIFKDGNIVGSVYQNGELRIAGGTTVTGEVLADNHDDFNTGAAIPEDGRLDMSIDTTQFDSDLLRANTGATITNDTSGNAVLDLEGGIIVVDSLPSDPAIIKGGPGTLVIKSGHVFGQDFYVESGVTIIVDGNLKISHNGYFEDGITMFSTGEMDLFKHATAEVITGTGNAFLALGDMKIKKELTFDGIIFSEGEITADKDLDVTGTIITQEGFTLKKDATVTFDASVIPTYVRNNLIISTFFVQSSIWNEIAVD